MNRLLIVDNEPNTLASLAQESCMGQHGTGLGLAIIQSVVSDHRGKISVTSIPAQGATFLIDLPAAQGDLV